MPVWGLHSDLGKPSVPRTVTARGAPGKGTRWPRTRAAETVVLVATRGQSGQGGRGGRSGLDVRGNSERAKGPWSAKGSVEEVDRMTSPRAGAAWWGTLPTLCEEPPREGEGAERPLSRPSAVGENAP